jgi:cytochrome c biogenesis protein CcmG/thiol:disulfide interchange protein DsbE
VFVALAVVGVIAVAAIGSVLAISRSSETAIVVKRGAQGTGALERAPVLTGSDPITGKTVSLADFAGKPVVVNIWANWCPGCRKEAPALRRLAKAHPEAVVLGIDFQDTVSGARSFYEDFELSHPSIFDPNGKLARRLGLVGMPTTVFLNAEHEIVARIVGETDLAGFEQGLAAATSAS